MRADRLLSILLLLQVRGRMTARVLAQRFEVSERTIYRDMDALSAAGVPVVAERGIGGGWSLLEGYHTNLTGLNEAEIQTLFLSKPARLLADLGLGQASETALNKLLAALPSMHRRDAEYVRQRIHVDAQGWSSSEENVSYLPVLQEAIWQERKLYLTYHLSTGPTVECALDPLGLVAKGNVWYLVGVYDGEVCVYRVSRVLHAAVADQPCVRPAGFDLATFWERSSAEFQARRPRYPATLRADPAILPELSCRVRGLRVEEAGPPGADGWVTLSLEFESEDDACGQVLTFGGRIEAVEPAELRRAIAGHAQSVLELHTAEEAEPPHPRPLSPRGREVRRPGEAPRGPTGRGRG